MGLRRAATSSFTLIALANGTGDLRILVGNWSTAAAQLWRLEALSGCLSGIGACETDLAA